MNTKSSRAAALASAITANIVKIDELLASDDRPPLSLDDAPAPLQQSGSSQKFLEAREATLEAISELEALVLGPLGILQKASSAVEAFFLFFFFSFFVFRGAH